MKKLNVYLSGATKYVDDSFQNWRSDCIEIEMYGLGCSGIYTKLNFINPIAYFNYTHNKPKTEKQCINLFMWLVDKSDILLLNLDDSDKSIGTGMEIEHAFCRGIPIIAFGKNPDTWYNWAEERATVIFDDLEDAVMYINDYYAKSILN